MSHSFKKFLVPAAALAGVISAVAPASAADTTFASYSATASGAFKTTDVGHTVVITDAKPVLFSFLNTNLASKISGVKAVLTFTASSPKADYGTGTVFGIKYGAQTPITGSYAFASTQAYTIGSSYYAPGSNLLTVTFGGASLAGQIGGKTATFSDDTTLGGSITYSSAFLTFSNTLTKDFADSLTALSASFGGTTTLTPFTATPGGSFSADPLPLSTAVVPEPATWLMMLAGFGAIGMGIRTSLRRKPRLA